MSGRRSAGRPSVVFLDYGTWEAFSAFASALRRRGVAVQRGIVRPRDLPHRVMEFAERLVYGRANYVVQRPAGRGSAARAELTPEVFPPGVVDIQAPDDLLLQLAIESPEAARVMNKTRPLELTASLFHKTFMLDLAQTLGVAVPRSYTTPAPEEFPVVVKSDVGSGGDRVIVARDEGELASAMTRLTALAGETPKIQEFFGGTVLGVGAVAREGELVLAVTYATEPSPHDPAGPPARVTAIDRPDAIEASARILAAVGYTGQVCLQFVLDDDGEIYFIDFNPRSFGSWPALQELGADFIGAYLYALGCGPRPPVSQIRLGETRALLRFPLVADDLTDIALWCRESLSIVAVRTPLLGMRWGVLSALKIIAGAAEALGGIVFGGAAPEDTEDRSQLREA